MATDNVPQHYDADDILDWMGDDRPNPYPNLAYEVVLNEDEAQANEGELSQPC